MLEYFMDLNQTSNSQIFWTNQNVGFFSGRGGHVKRPGCLSYLLGVKKAVLVPLRIFSQKKNLQWELSQNLSGY